MQAYSLDLCQRIVQAYEQGQGSIPEIAQRFCVSPAFVSKMWRQWRETSDLAPLPHGGGKPSSLSKRQLQLLKRKAQQQSDASLVELQQLLADEHQVNVHLSTTSRALAKLGLPRKKSA